MPSDPAPSLPLHPPLQADTHSEHHRDEVRNGWQVVSPAKSPQREVREMTLAAHALACRQLLRSGNRDKAVHLTAPKDGLVRCFIRRDMGMFGLARSYELRTEEGSMFLLSACEWQCDKGSSLRISQTLEDKHDKGAAQLNVSHNGTEYSLWGQSKAPANSSAQMQYDEFGNVLQASADPVAVTASPAVRIQVFKVSKPNGMTVTLPLAPSGADDLSIQPTSRLSSAISLAPRRDRTSEVAVLVKRGLRVDRRAHRFEGRNPVKSNKNFQLVYWTEASNSDAKVLLQLCKISDSTYALDFAYPFTAETAFAVALAAMVNRIGN